MSAWSDRVKEHAERFVLGGKMGCDVVLKPDAARAIGELIANLARTLDETERRRELAERIVASMMAEARLRRESRRRLLNDVWQSACWFGLLVALCWVLS